MVTVSLRYRFRQPFRVPAAAAFEWCTDFRPSDARLYGDGRRREVRRLTADTLVMTDTTRPKGRPVRISRLVRLFPEQRAWTNTHLTGPYRHSQFWYRIEADSPRRSHLDFSGLMLMTRARPLPATEREMLADQHRRADAGVWRRRLAPALESDLARR